MSHAGWRPCFARLVADATSDFYRQLEIASVLVGFEQSNKYAITSLDGTPVGYLVEEESGMLGTVSRQALRTRRPFRAAVLDLAGKPILWVRRPFQLINSKIYVQSSEGVDPPLVGEAQQSWHLWRRRYDLFKARQRGGGLELDQFGAIDEGLWAWDFWAKDEEGRARASINRNFGGLGREVCLPTSLMVLRARLTSLFCAFEDLYRHRCAEMCSLPFFGRQII